MLATVSDVKLVADEHAVCILVQWLEGSLVPRPRPAFCRLQYFRSRVGRACRNEASLSVQC